MRQLISRKNAALAAALVAVFGATGFVASRLLPAPSFATAAISAVGGLPAEGELEKIARTVDTRLADRGLPARVTATRTQISILVPPSSKDEVEVQALLAEALQDLPMLGLPPTETPYVLERVEANLDKIRRAEEVVAQRAELASATSPGGSEFDFNSYAQAVLTLAAESERLEAVVAAFDPELQTIRWSEPRIGMQTQRVSGLALTAAGAAFGLLLFLIVAMIGSTRRRSAVVPA